MLHIPSPTPQIVPPKLLLKDIEVAQRLCCSRRHVWTLLETGQLCPPVRLGRLVRWRTADIELWVSKLITVREVEPETPRQGRPRRRP